MWSFVFKHSSITLKGFSPEYAPLFDGFLNELSKQGMASGSIGTWRSRLFRLELFLKNQGIQYFGMIELSHVNTYVETLASVDRDNPLGKRNYAIFILVAKLGLRISDARGLRFDSINWKTKIITIHQKKTFRHSIATTMLENGAKITEIAQVLGHAVPESAETYISLDISMLRQCALEVNL